MDSQRRREDTVCKPRPHVGLRKANPVDGCHKERSYYSGITVLVPSLVKYWIPVVAWMLLIFVASGDLLSAEHTSRFLVPLLHWIAPDISPATIASIQLLVRKCAHLTEYAILAGFLYRALRQGQDGFWRAAALAFVLAAIYASLDEFHQSFVPSRTGSPWDVLIDCIGAMLGLAVCVCFLRQSLKVTSGKFAS
jgi:VanZ family protein